MKISLLFVCIILNFYGFAQDKPLGLNVGDEAPGFTAKDQQGNEVNLKKLLKSGPVVLLFYRGEWCPFCNKQLSAMQDSLSLISGKGATVLAVTPEKPENISKTIEKTKATYPVLFDDGLKIMKSYKVSFEIEASMIEKYKGYGIDFATVNGNNGANLPVPAVYIIDKKGKITFRHFDPDYRKRPTVKQLLSQL